MKIQDDNMDELMFRLLEGEITGEERELLLQAIAADSAYSAQWEAWQKTILDPSQELIVMNTAPLKKKNHRAIVYWRQAAVIALIAGTGIWLYVAGSGGRKQDNSTNVVSSHQVPVHPESAAKGPAPRIMPVDTAKGFKQKVEHMAQHHPLSPRAKQEKHPAITPEAPLQILPSPSPVNDVIPAPAPEFVIADNTGVKPAAPKVIPTDETFEVSVVTETKVKNEKPNLNSIIENQRNVLGRIFSKPKLKVITDTSKITNRKFIIENDQYKIMAGF